MELSGKSGRLVSASNKAVTQGPTCRCCGGYLSLQGLGQGTAAWCLKCDILWSWKEGFWKVFAVQTISGLQGVFIVWDLEEL